jgi:hypothetical protein
MHGKASTGRQHTGGYPRLAAGQAAYGHPRRLPGAGADEARAAPFAVSWPYRTFLELGALAGAVPSARLHARLVLREWGLAALGDDTEQVLAELVSNGVRASRAMRRDAVRIWLVSDLGQVVVFVWDASPRRLPVPAAPGVDAESGRGLLLVEALSQRWGYFGHDDGKVVWALMQVPPWCPCRWFHPLTDRRDASTHPGTEGRRRSTGDV